MTLTPTNLRVNDVHDPVGTPGKPYFGWHCEAAETEQIQTHFQLLVARSAARLAAGEGEVWDSGRVASRSQNYIDYGGPPLTADTRYFWTVRVWDKAGRAGPYAEAATFVVGLLAAEDWAGAQWIRRETLDPDDYTYYRQRVTLPPKPLAGARLYIAAAHKYELYLNGRWVGAGPSYHYPQYQYYNGYEVGAYLHTGAGNVVAVLTHWFGGGQGRPASARGLLVKLTLEFADGSRTVIGTDGSWKQTRAAAWLLGQPSRNDEGVGYIEKIDAAQLIPDWHAPAYDDGGWEAASVIGPPPAAPWTGKLIPDLSRIVEREVGPAAIIDHGQGRYVVDLGEVQAGRPRIAFSGGEAGALITMRGGYTLTQAGTVDAAASQNTDMAYYAVANGGEFVFQPQEYLGMRYFQVDDAPMPVTGENWAFIARHAALDESRSWFTTSDPTLNRVWDLMKRSLYLGAQEQFLDTPTREKGGFLVDSAHESLAAMAAFGERVLTLKTLNEFLQSMDQYWSSTADWGRMNAVYPNGDGARDIPDFTQAYLVWVWEYYLQTGHRQFLSDHYAKLKAIADYVRRYRNGSTGLIHRLTGGAGPYQYGIVDWPPSMRYGYDMDTDARTVINALAYADYTIVGEIAAALGKAAEAAHYRALAEALKAAMNTRLINAEGVYVDGLRADGTQSAHASQQANMLPLALGLAPDAHRAAVLEHVKALKVSAGLVTMGWLIRALGEADEGEHLLAVYTRPDWDNWANSLAKGATSTWESWDADTGNGLSQSHPWGAVGLCGLQQYVLGVRPLTPQFETVAVKPLAFGALLTSASGKVPTDRGEIEVHWERNNRRFALTLTLPANVRARVCVPRGEAAGGLVEVDGASAPGVVEGRYLVVEDVGSGRHTFELEV